MNRAWKEATQQSNLTAMRELLAIAGNRDARDEHGQTALMNAACKGQLEVVRLLITQGADLNVAVKYGLTALMLAVVNGHSKIACELIRAGADVTCLGTGVYGFAGKTALDLARARGLSEVVSLLLQNDPGHIGDVGP